MRNTHEKISDRETSSQRERLKQPEHTGMDWIGLTHKQPLVPQYFFFFFVSFFFLNKSFIQKHTHIRSKKEKKNQNNNDGTGKFVLVEKCCVPLNVRTNVTEFCVSFVFSFTILNKYEFNSTNIAVKRPYLILLFLNTGSSAHCELIVYTHFSVFFSETTSIY